MTAVSETARDIALPGTTLHVATWGEPSPDRAVLLVHGLTANSRYWAEFGPRLAATGWYAVAPDLRGRGRSAKPPHGYGLPFHAADILSLGDALGIPAFHYVGHSLGALIGLYLGALHPGRLRRLTLVDAGGKLPEDTVQAIAPALARLGMTYPSLGAYLAAVQSPVFTPWAPFWERYFRYDAEVHPDGTAASGVPPAAIAEEQAALWATRTEELPAFVRAPTLIVRATEGLLGGDRGLLLPRPEADRLLGLIPDSRLEEIPATNHYTVVLADRFAETVLVWLAAGG